jgi:hypothetical protein
MGGEPKTVESAVATALDLIDPTGDPEAAHDEAERIMLAALGPEVKAAYDRLVERAPWWASA